MKAAVRRTYGQPNQLKVEDLPIPSPKAGQILVRVKATTVNRTDCAVLTGKPYIMRLFLGLSKPRKIIPGTDFAGIVEAIGDQVDTFKVNDKVWGFSDEGLQSQAEFLLISAKGKIAQMPDKIDFDQAAASLEGAHYAYNFIKKHDLGPEHKILVNGATGAIGSALLQMLKANGIYVTAVGNTKNIGLLKSLGANKTYDYLKEDFTQDEEKYDMVLDAVGKSRFSKCKKLLKEGGIYISSELGPNAENIFLALRGKFSKAKRVVFPFPTQVKRSMAYMRQLIEAGKFKAIIDRTYPLEKIGEAYTYVASGQKTGNVVIRIP